MEQFLLFVRGTTQWITMKAKTLILAMIMLLSAGMAVQAQRVALGAKVGFTASSFRTNEAVNVEIREGAVGGIFLNAYFLKVLAVQPEVNFKQSGGAYEYGPNGVKQHIKTNNIQVPVLFKLQIPIANTVFPNIYAGPQYSYAIYREYSASTNGGQMVLTDADIERNDFGGVFGAGIDVRVKRFFWTIDFRYGMGAIRIEDSNNINMDLKNQDFTLSTGVGVIMGKVR